VIVGTHPIADGELEQLLYDVYVGGGFTDPAVAAQMFTAAAVRARGSLVTARTESGHLLGMVIVVAPGSAGHRLGGPHEAEMHLLAVTRSARGKGVGTALIAAAMGSARDLGLPAMVLWTQPAMIEAQRLYLAAGFARAPARDFRHGTREFMVFEAKL
jgi:ribosomal protein S18 acetylase RimI-like enzyme